MKSRTEIGADKSLPVTPIYFPTIDRAEGRTRYRNDDMLSLNFNIKVNHSQSLAYRSQR
jgi:hypothetical protein